MKTKFISRRQAEEIRPLRVEREIATSHETDDEIAWFTDDDGNLFGTLTVGNGRKSWGYVILGRSERGELLLLARRTNYRTWEVAELQLLLAMDAARKRRRALLTQPAEVREVSSPKYSNSKTSGRPSR
jgi:hypothetical protein